MLKNIFQYRVHVALLAGLLTLASFAPNQTPETYAIGLAMGMVMAWVYLFNKTTDNVEDNINTGALPIPDDKRAQTKKIAFACLLIPLLWLWSRPTVLAVYLIFGGLVGYLYSKPIMGIRLKQILIVKNLSSSLLIWTPCTMLPYFLLSPTFHQDMFLREALGVLVLVTCIEILWDIRDVDGDRVANVRTLPNTFGITAAKIIALAMLGAYCAWMYAQNMPSIIIVAGHALTALVIAFANQKRPYWYYQLIVLIWILISLLALSL